ncbi:LAG3 protein, partial [Semnornis frantzii]|nr:LAG3 protein [Semnornis frantzii]
MRPRLSVQDSALRSGNFSLWISPVRSGDAGLYEARVGYNAEVLSCRVQLGVITVSPSQPSPVVENEPLLLSCSSSHRASLMETCWFHNRHLLPTSRPLCFLHGAHLVLRPAMSDAGYWRCQLRYSDNEVVSATYNLRVLGNGPSNSIVYAAAGSAAD